MQPPTHENVETYGIPSGAFHKQLNVTRMSAMYPVTEAEMVSMSAVGFVSQAFTGLGMFLLALAAGFKWDIFIASESTPKEANGLAALCLWGGIACMIVSVCMIFLRRSIMKKIKAECKVIQIN